MLPLPSISSLAPLLFLSIISLSVIGLTYLDIQHKNKTISQLVSENTALKIQNAQLKVQLSELEKQLKTCSQAMSDIILTGSSLYFSSSELRQSDVLKQEIVNSISLFNWQFDNTELRICTQSKNSTGNSTQGLCRQDKEASGKASH